MLGLRRSTWVLVRIVICFAATYRTFTGELCSRTHFMQAEILVLVGGPFPAAPVVTSSTMISGRLKLVQEHASAVNMH